MGNSELFSGFSSGKAEMIFPNGDKYNGPWENDKMHNLKSNAIKGKMTYHLTKDEYEGGWVNGKRQTHSNCKSGVMKYNKHYRGVRGDGRLSGGGLYEGEWLDDMRHGQGVMKYYEDGRVLDGEWDKDVFVR